MTAARTLSLPDGRNGSTGAGAGLINLAASDAGDVLRWREERARTEERKSQWHTVYAPHARKLHKI